MIDFVLGVLFSWYFMCFCIVAIFTTLHNEAEAWAGFWTFLVGVSLYGMFNIDVETLGYMAILWLPIGIAWSLWRFKRYTRYIMLKSDMKSMNNSELNRLKDRISPSGNISRIVGWIIAWPFSLIENIFSDLFTLISEIVRTHLIGLYNQIVRGYLGEIEQAKRNRQ